MLLLTCMAKTPKTGFDLYFDSQMDDPKIRAAYKVARAALQEAGPSVQKHGVSASKRRARANGIRQAAKKVKSKSQARILNSIATAIEDGEAREACLLYGKLSAEGRKALPRNSAMACKEENEIFNSMYLYLD
jgi:hypothetical protein